MSKRTVAIIGWVVMILALWGAVDIVSSVHDAISG